ncbi:MAG: peptide chain release factor 1 [Clostridiales bacterium]|nr:peptide chain release factor 1 [Clostridiales bacterium]
MFEKLEDITKKYEYLSGQISDAAVIANQEVWRDLCREHAGLEPIVSKFSEYKKAKDTVDEARTLLGGALEKDFREMVQEELDAERAHLEGLENEIKLLLLPKDVNDDKSVIMEIRGGAGGDEAALFAADLLRMYQMYSDAHGWKTEMLNVNATELGGIKEVSFEINGVGAYSRLKYESGVHRVQRIPSTESGGRIHTSTVTVAVLPVVDEIEVEINPNDIRTDVFRAGGPGGQCVNTTDSAVRLTHIPTGLVVSCQDEKSQLKNKDKAMKILRSRLYELLQGQQDAEIAAQRKNQVGTGDRSERIRTYNFPQGRCTDHRIGLTLHKLDSVMNGEIDEIVEALTTHYQAEQLKGENHEN